MNLDKPLPHNNEIEQEILGMMMMFEDINELVKHIVKVKSTDFYNPHNQRIFTSISELAYSGIIPDLVNISAKFPDTPSYIMELVENIVTTANIESKIRLLKELSLRRQVITELSTKIDNFWEEPEVTNELERLVSGLTSLSGDYKPRKSFTTKDTVSEVADMIKKTALGQSTQIVPYCITAIDSLLTLLRKQMHVLGANSGIGKTAFILSAMSKQMRSGVKTILFCGESSRHELLERLISIEIHKPFMWITNGMQGATDMDLKAYIEAMNMFTKLSDMFVIYGKGDYEHSLTGIREAMQIETARHGQLDMMYTDYLQNMKPPKNAKTQEERTSLNIQGLNNIIAEYNTAGTVLSQVNREAGKMKKPYMEQLKYASTIENEAHVITFLHRQKEARPNSAGIMETEWYSDKTRVQQGIYTKLAFHAQRAEYTGLYSEEYRGNQALNGNVKE